MVMKRKPNIILIVMDTVRADHLSCYGYFRKTTPNLDKIAGKGVLFENAFSAAPWTPPSHASIFSGSYPSEHKTIGRNISLRKDVELLSQVLSEKHFRTIGLTCCNLLSRRSGFSRGFQEYADIGETRKTVSLVSKDLFSSILNGPDKGAYVTNELAKKMLRRHFSRNTQQPFFMFINYFECHTPYDPPRPFKKMFCNEKFRQKGNVREIVIRKILGRTTETVDDPDLDIRKLQKISSGEGGFSFSTKKLSISTKEWDMVKSWYDGELNYLDFRIGELISFLQNEGVFEDTLFVLTSDHGENFGEHGLAVHPLCLYDSVLRVPLIFGGGPMSSGEKKLSQIVSTVDIFPTILDIVGLKTPTNIAGRTLSPFEDRIVHQFVCAEYGGLHLLSLKAPQFSKELDLIDQGCKCIRNQNYKYIYYANKEELYDLKEDPGEKVNIALKHPEKAIKLKRELQKTIDISYFGPKDFSPDTNMMDRLKALGYA